MNSSAIWPDRIFLCGFMGSGKSTIGWNLAAFAERPFVDLDTEIVEREGQPISDIFSRHGEPYFRRVERETLEEIMETRQGIIALGGGALHNQQVVDRIKASGLLIYMAASLTNLIRRIQNDRERPLLLDAEGRLKSVDQLQTELGKRFRERQQWYRQADITLQTDRFESAGEATQHLIDRINTYAKNH